MYGDIQSIVVMSWSKDQIGYCTLRSGAPQKNRMITYPSYRRLARYIIDSGKFKISPTHFCVGFVAIPKEGK
jgi:hypothetical protein